MADFTFTNESLGYPEYPPEAIPQPRMYRTPYGEQPGISYRQLLDLETAPWAGAYDPRQYHEPAAVQQRAQDMAKLERRLKIENLLQMREQAAQNAAALANYRNQMLARQRAEDARKAFEKKPVTESLRKQLEGSAGMLEAATGVARSFKPEYVGRVPIVGIGSETMGDIENFARDILPGLSTEMPNWWREYRGLDEMKRRNEAFGATLSPNEQRAWERSAINLRMKPDDIQKSLNIRVAILKRQLDRLQAGARPSYKAEEIEAYGGQPIPEAAPRWQEGVDMEGLAEQGRRLTGSVVGSRRVLSPERRRAIEMELERRQGGGR